MIVEIWESGIIPVVEFSSFDKYQLCIGICKRLHVVYYNVLITVIDVLSIGWWTAFFLMPGIFKMEPNFDILV